MSSLSEAATHRTTLGMLADRYGYELSPKFSRAVTVTSLASDIDSVTAGSLFMPGKRIDAARVAAASRKGAYAVMLPKSMRSSDLEADIPLVYADPTPREIGQIASNMTGNPAGTLAVFAIAGINDDQIHANVEMLSQFLHMLGNPVGTICAGDSQSLDRFLDLRYPMDILSMQRVLSVCSEDGAAAVILALDDNTLQPDALQSVGADVIGYDGVANPMAGQDLVEQACERYGCGIDEGTHIAFRTDETDQMAVQADFGLDKVRSLSLAIAMVMAAGVKKANIRSALRVSRELH